MVPDQCNIDVHRTPTAHQPLAVAFAAPATHTCVYMLVVLFMCACILRARVAYEVSVHGSMSLLDGEFNHEVVGAHVAWMDARAFTVGDACSSPGHASTACTPGPALATQHSRHVPSSLPTRVPSCRAVAGSACAMELASQSTSSGFGQTIHTGHGHFHKPSPTLIPGKLVYSTALTRKSDMTPNIDTVVLYSLSTIPLRSPSALDRMA